MDLEECLRREVAAVVAVMDRVLPRLVDVRPWPLRLASILFAVIF
jgi:hypothetical protein